MLLPVMCMPSTLAVYNANRIFQFSRSFTPRHYRGIFADVSGDRAAACALLVKCPRVSGLPKLQMYSETYHCGRVYLVRVIR